METGDCHNVKCEHILQSDHSVTSTGDTSTKIGENNAIFLVLELILCVPDIKSFQLMQLGATLTCHNIEIKTCLDHILLDNAQTGPKLYIK